MFRVTADGSDRKVFSSTTIGLSVSKSLSLTRLEEFPVLIIITA